MRIIIRRKEIESIVGKATKIILDSKRDLEVESGWHQHLKTKKIGVVATSMALIYLNKQSQDSHILEDAYEFISVSQNPDGGWSYISNLPDKSNTEATCWALLALNHQKGQYQTQIDNGINWLYSKINTEGNNDSGWGFIDNKYSRTYNTCLVLRTLIELSEIQSFKFESAIHWLLFSQNPDGGWGEKYGAQSNVFYTSYVVTTLVKSGKGKDETFIRKALEWIEKEVELNKYNSPNILCTLEFIEENCEGKKSRTPFFHFNIPHIIQAFIITGNYKKKIVFEGVYELIRTNDNGSWNHPFIENSKIIPIWAIYDSIETFLDYKHQYEKWDKIHYLIFRCKKTRVIYKYNFIVRLWDKINPALVQFICILLVVLLVVYSSIKLYSIIPNWILKRYDSYINFLLSVVSSLVASFIIFLSNYIFRKKSNNSFH